MDNVNNHQTVVLKDRSDLLIDGVENIITFDETYVALETSSGKLNIEGNDLKVDSLCKEDGKIHIIGSVKGIFYSTDGGKKSGIGRLFK